MAKAAEPPAAVVRAHLVGEVRAMIDAMLASVLTHPHLDDSRKFHAESLLTQLRRQVDGLDAH